MNNHETDTSKDKSTTILVWNEYAHYHDYLIELLYYGRKENYHKSNVWEFQYV